MKPRTFLRLFLFPSLVASLAMAPAVAQEAEPPARWHVDWGKHVCTLSRDSMGAMPLRFALQIVPGSDGFRLFLLGESWQADAFEDGDKAILRLLPSGVGFEVYVKSGKQGNGDRYLILSNADEPMLLDALTAAREISLERDGAARFRFPMPSPTPAMTVLRHCIDTTLERWEVDPKAYAALAKRPEFYEGEHFVKAHDFPAEAVRQNTAGLVVMRLAVTEEGRVSDCRVLASSGNKAVDRNTCRAARARGRFHPAIDANGKPTATPMIVAVRWQVF